MVKVMLGSLAFLVSGCASINSQLQFSKQDLGYQPNFKVTGTAKVRFSKVQEFRSLLESLEYRVSEKAK